jgi:hypothetical protein
MMLKSAPIGSHYKHFQLLQRNDGFDDATA